MTSFTGKKIILGVTGSIAAYKAVELVRLLKETGAEVRVVLTQGGAAFISPLTFQAISGQAVHTHLLDATSEAAMDHISLAKWADFILVAPASANFIARLAQGFADDLLTTLCLATSAPIALAPAMNQAMWRNPLTQKNCEQLKAAKINLWGPAIGSQACGDQGPGRLLEPTEILSHLSTVFLMSPFSKKILAGKSIVITAGPTREAIDPVRYLSNHSSGKMGYALAQAAQAAGASVTLISGPTTLTAPQEVTLISVISAQEMLTACEIACAHCDIFIAAAAVADYRISEIAPEKMKKTNTSLTLTLEPTKDILAHIAHQKLKPFCVGFAAETQQLEKYAKEKLQRKQLDLIVANDVSNSAIGFNAEDNAVTVYSAQGNKIILAQTAKIKIAEQLIAIIAEQMHSRAQ